MIKNVNYSSPSYDPRSSSVGNVPPGVNPEAYQWFRTVDTDQNGSISLNELKQALVNSNWSTFNDETSLMMMSK